MCRPAEHRRTAPAQRELWKNLQVHISMPEWVADLAELLLQPCWTWDVQAVVSMLAASSASQSIALCTTTQAQAQAQGLHGQNWKGETHPHTPTQTAPGTGQTMLRCKIVSWRVATDIAAAVPGDHLSKLLLLVLQRLCCILNRVVSRGLELCLKLLQHRCTEVPPSHLSPTR